MATKRPGSPQLVPNPFIKKRNLEWSIVITGESHDAASSAGSDDSKDEIEQPPPSAVEAGKASIENHLDYFHALLTRTTVSLYPLGTPHLSTERYRKLYEANAGNPKGSHFIIHQHDHPIAGTHYDLRLQINETSSASWAIMYGLPGDPNSFRLNRNATETRIHCLWNHLIETASHATGSLLIWDTGTYTILPAKPSTSQDNSQSSSESDHDLPQLTEQQKLHQAFAARKIRLRLHGARLPSNYVLNLRLTREEDATGRARSTRTPKTRRRRGGAQSTASGRITRSSTKGKKIPEPTTSSDSEPVHRTKQQDTKTTDDGDGDDDTDIVHAPSEQLTEAEKDKDKDISPTERELRELEDDEVRRTNAYPGATNSIHSVHQRRWYLSLDREEAGFVKRRRDGKTIWESGPVTTKRDAGDADESRLAYPFYVRGVEYERSVVTGRLGSEVLRDEGVVGFIGRKGWQAVMK
ncbi:hypothetical protein F4777DRAFT_212552 [Nemania sp. FL0916]|nr:hypothetical protein F4777DRAFT_212552 [Nemania sp. FL0916]